MELIFLIIILICFFVALVLGMIATIALAFKYLVLSLIAFVLIIGVWTWIKLGYDKTKRWIYKKVHYRNGTYKI